MNREPETEVQWEYLNGLEERELVEEIKWAKGETERLRAENAELSNENNKFRLELHEWSKCELELEDARRESAELGWFRRREALVEAIKAATSPHAEALATLALQEWEEINPKPRAGT